MDLFAQANNKEPRGLPLWQRKSAPQQAILHSGFRIARDTILAELFGDRQVIVVTGPPGTGKTFLLHELMRVLSSAGWDATLHANSDLADLPAAEPNSPATSPRAVLIDEADRLEPSLLHSILRSPHPVVLAGLDSLLDRVPTGRHVRLVPLPASESADYIASWMVQAGHRPDLLSGDVLVRTVELSRGIPRLLSTVLSEAMWRAGTRPTLQVSTADIESAASGRDSTADTPDVTAPEVTAHDVTAPGATSADAMLADPLGGPDQPPRDLRPIAGDAPELARWTAGPELPPSLTAQHATAPSTISYAGEGLRRLGIARTATAAAAGVVFGIGVGLIGLNLLAWLAQPPPALQIDGLPPAPTPAPAEAGANHGPAVTSRPVTPSPSPTQPPSRSR